MSKTILFSFHNFLVTTSQSTAPLATVSPTKAVSILLPSIVSTENQSLSTTHVTETSESVGKSDPVPAKKAKLAEKSGKTQTRVKKKKNEYSTKRKAKHHKTKGESTSSKVGFFEYVILIEYFLFSVTILVL